MGNASLANMVWEDIEFDADKVPGIKLALHIAQIVFAVIAWVLEIIVFRAEGSVINGNVGWTFAVVRLTSNHTPTFVLQQSLE